MGNLIIKLKNIRSKYGYSSMLYDKIIMIRNRMASEGNTDYSNSEIQRCLKNCVGAKILIPLAIELRDKNLL